MNDFASLGLPDAVCRTLDAIGIKEPTPIQRDAIPHLLAGHDLLGLAQTGTGKTAAFSLPVVHHLMGLGRRPNPGKPRALILAPTRELANQIAHAMKSYVRDTHLRVEVVVGGASLHIQEKKLQRGADILVATPGRLLDLTDRKVLKLDEVKYLVLDEADQMLDLGFIHSLRRIARMVPQQRQTMLFSATMPAQIEELGRAFLSDPVRVEVARSGKTADKIKQSVFFVDQKSKYTVLRDLLAKRPSDISVVFARTKHGAERLKKQLEADGLNAVSVHGNKSQNQREKAISDFRGGKSNILVATDVAARGIDISGVTHVYNYELPEVSEVYVHRIGRTARAGAEGEAVSLCGAHEMHLFLAIEKLIGIDIPVAGGEPFARSEAIAAKRGRGRDQAHGRAEPGIAKDRHPSKRRNDRPKRSFDGPRFEDGEREGGEDRAPRRGAPKRPHRKGQGPNTRTGKPPRRDDEMSFSPEGEAKRSFGGNRKPARNPEEFGDRKPFADRGERSERSEGGRKFDRSKGRGEGRAEGAGSDRPRRKSDWNGDGQRKSREGGRDGGSEAKSGPRRTKPKKAFRGRKPRKGANG